MMFNKLLQRQINKYAGSTDALPENITNLLQVINDSYSHYEKDRKMLERTIELCSTEMIQLNSKLRKETQELKTLFEAMREVFFSVDMEAVQLIQISKACELVYGHSVGEFMENPNLWAELVVDQDKHIVESIFPKLELGQPFIVSYRIRHKDRSIRWLETRMTPTLNKEGKVIRIDGFTSDITERKAAESSLLQSEHRFQNLIQNTFDAIILVDKDLKMVFVSDSMYRITGFKPEELIGIKDFSFAHPDDKEMIYQFLDDIMKHPGKTGSIEYRRLKKDGSYIWCERMVTNLLHDPAINGIVSNLRNIDERKKYEVALKASNEELKKSNMELDKFVYSVSHDLRAPLSSILGLVEFSETETTDPAVLEDYGSIKKSVKKLDGFIQDILDYSRNSRLEIRKEKINFTEVLNDVTNNLKFMSQAKGQVDIRIDVQDGPDFYTDKSRMSIILNNLVSNAIRYHNAKDSNPYVKISVVPDEHGVNITVNDNGIGIDKKYHEKIFDMFYRVSKKSVGSGLGLYIVKETIERLDGSLHLESEPGIGTTFNVIIPNAVNKEQQHNLINNYNLI
ncbi:MAG: PAS domain-containing sensor histidine kinase [Taibaiella sp.]|jgi:PAS domain S-box-containing protein